MDLRPLGHIGPQVPCVGLGTWRRFDLPRPQEYLARQIVELALENGVRVFDTAPVYGRAEEVLSRALSAHRDRAYVATKIWAGERHTGRRQFERQLHLFQGRVDLLQLHHLIGWRTHAEWMQQERERGTIGQLGLTYWRDRAFGGGTASELEEAMRTGVFDVIQIPLNPVERDMEERILPLAKELGIGVMVMRPFAEGSLLSSSRRSVPPKETGCATASEALLRWGLSDARVAVTLPATLDLGHLIANTAAGSAPPLDEEQRTAIAALYR